MKQASRTGVLGEAARRWIAAAGVALGLVACGPQDLTGAHALGGGTDASVAARRVDLAPPAAPATAAETDQKASIHAAYLSARMKEAASDVRYAITPSKLAPLVARSWSKGFEGRFDERGVALSAEGQDWQGRMDVVRFGCGEKLDAVTGGAAPVRDGKDANRLSYVRHAGKETFTETWVNGEPGMEQGFTVERSPCAKRGGASSELTIEIAVDGLTVGMRDGKTEGGAVELRGEDGGVRLRYADLYAYDAAGTVLPARMVVDGGRVALRVGVDGGTRWPVVVDPVVATQEVKLTALDLRVAGNQTGYSVSVSGDTALVGMGKPGFSAQAYVYVRAGTMWTEQAALAVSSGAGSAVSVSGDAAVLGGADRAYVFARTGTTWAPEASASGPQGQINASDRAVGDQFGVSASVSGDTALVGANLAAIGTNTAQGAAYVFTKVGTTWTQQGKLTASDGAAGDQFGASVSVNGGTALVGANLAAIGANTAQGAVYVFTKAGTTWTQQGKLTASDGAVSDGFGASVSLDVDTGLVGAKLDDVAGAADQGSAYVFARKGTTWTQQAQLVASDGAVSDNFGTAVSASGNTAVVGANLDDVAGAANQGSAYTFARSGTTWAQQAHLVASDGAAGDNFGVSVSVSGNTGLVGAFLDSALGTNTNTGSSHVFTQTGTTWAEQASLGPTNGAAGDQFGYAVAMRDNTAVVGASSSDFPYVDGGAAYVFVRSGTVWAEQAHLRAPVGGGQFGSAVALGLDMVVVGAPGASSAYVFLRKGTAWSGDAAAGMPTPQVLNGDPAPLRFGASVSVGSNFVTYYPQPSGETFVAVGAPGPVVTTFGAPPGAAYVFRNVVGGISFFRTAKLTASDGAPGDHFGGSVSLSRDPLGPQTVTALVGAADDTVGANAGQGSVYVFTRATNPNAAWGEEAHLTASDGAAGDQFGASVSLSGDMALVGAPSDDILSAADQGSAYVFLRSGTVWSPQPKLTGGVAGNLLGSSVSVCGNTALVGGPLSGIGALQAGVVMVFSLSGSSWTPQPYLSASDRAATDHFGSSVSTNGDALPELWTQNTSGGKPPVMTPPVVAGTALVGSPLADVVGVADQGAAYAFQLHGVAGYPCAVAGDCAGSYFCVDGVCCTSACGSFCDVCSVALGAQNDGTCAPIPSGAPGQPACFGDVLCDGVGVACLSGCVNDSQCAVGSYCTSAATCAPAKATGQSCDPTTECKNSASCALCQSGNCVDGFCCNVPCNGSCESCAAAASTGPSGTCSAVTVGTPSTPTPQYPQGCPGGVLCNGLARSCPGGCTLDTQCSPGNYCDLSSGACTLKKGHGVGCFASNECSTAGGCVDSVCCDTACTGLCQACTAALKVTGLDDGTCGSAVAGLDPHNQCSQDSPTTCGQTGSCDGSGACAYYGAATTCGSNVCVGNESRKQQCAGALTCQPSGSGGTCTPYACVTATGACATGCSSDAECAAPGNYCDAVAGKCVPRRSLGAICSVTNECAATTFCVDGFCCDSACTGSCQACAAALKESGADGQCGPVKQGTTDPGCVVKASATCGTTGACDANGACANWSSGTACGSTACDGASNTSTGQLCDGLGGCSQATTPVTCAPYQCGASACKTACASAGDCVAGYYCAGSTCVPLRLVGDTCTASSECGTTFCVDGFCCGSACAGGCQACSVAKKGGGVNGQCDVIAAGADPDNECAAQPASSCGQDGSCDGAGKCETWALGTVCASGACQGNVATPQVCVGLNQCGAASTGTDCGGYQCVAGACPGSCSADAQCSTGYYCDAGLSQCVPKKARGKSCGGSSQCATAGGCVDGVCCDTACTGVCQACAAALKTTGLDDGTCGSAVAGTDPHNQCSQDSPATCGQTGLCDGASACAFYGASTVCGPNVCVGNESRQQSCAGALSCQPSGTGVVCAPYACVSATGACATTCASDAECLAGSSYCDTASHTCAPKKLLGATCSGANECATNTFCVDGVCCNSACTGPCQACSAALKDSGASGQCGPAKAGTSDVACAAQAASSCGTTGSCDAAGQCAQWASGTACGVTACDGAANTSTGQLCDGLGGCSQATTPVTCAPYLCGASACKTTCASGADCVSGYYCQGTTCAQQRAVGAACSTGAECGSGFCVDGVCCGSACAGGCQACSAAKKGGGVNGQCDVIAAGTDPDDECAAQPASGCGQDGSCDGAGKCETWALGTVCGASVCQGNVAKAQVCVAPNQCGAATTGSDCGAYQCTAGTCPLSCTSDAFCAATSYCDTVSGACVAKKAQGAACTTASQCGTAGGCVDGVCCNATCGNTCLACSAALKESGADGECGPAKRNTDPHAQCGSETQSGCGQTGQCDGLGACQFYQDLKSACGPTVCSGNKVTGKVCIGQYQCGNDTQGIDCAPLKCSAGQCQACATGADCLDPTTTYCDTGDCKPRKAAGAACSAAEQCLSAFCVDGVCCETACNGQCEWCGDSAAPGTCVATQGAPKGTHPACSGTGACTGKCDGAKRDGCVYPDSATQCAPAKCVGDSVVSAATCDGTGVCAPGSQQACGSYACDSTAVSCKTSCTTKTDCRLGAVCDTSGATGACNTAGATCQGAYNVKAPDGTVSSCNGYRCVSGACQQQCGTTTDCATGYVCTGSSCVVGAPDAGVGSGGASGSGGSAAAGGTAGAAGRDASVGTGATAGAGGASATNTGGATGPDAGPSTSKGAAGNAGSATSKDSGGCGCRVPKGGGGRGTPLSVAVLALGIVAMRRRRGRARWADRDSMTRTGR